MSSIIQDENVWHKRQEAGGPPDNPGFRMKNLTTAQRDALSDATSRAAPRAGDLIFNTTTGTFQGFNGTEWVEVPGVPSDSVGEVTTPATTAVVEQGGPVDHFTQLTFTDFVVHATEPDNEDLAVGANFYSLPEGAFLIENASIYGTFTKAGEATIADGEIAIGTLIGSGAVDTTGEVDAAAENVLGPIVLSTSEFDGAEVYTTVAEPHLYVAPEGGVAHDLFLNIAATWPNVTPAGTVRFNGVITLRWKKIN